SLLTTSPKGETIAPPQTADSVAVGEPQAAEGGEKVVRATGSMAIATLISRVTGFIRTVLIGAALGEVVAASFNTANTLPNLITEIVLGSVLTALVVPVLVRAEKEDADHGAAFIRRLFTLTLT
ncbi:murein biosynthesis protein MurJ, partial [Mycobacterium tuberculosis]|nr:murein biosynthesis protein MurJ [Mycobacterium tuberculosis]